MLRIILIAVAAIAVVFVVIVVLQPADFRVARSAAISAPPPAVFAQVGDMEPVGKIDPAMKQSYEGAPAGPGAIYTWAGNKEVGAGRMTIAESRPNELIRVKLEFFKPFAATNTAEFAFVPEGNQTKITWSMFGEKNFMAKALHLFMNMDKMIGGQFEQGLASMKAAAEGAPKQ